MEFIKRMVMAATQSLVITAAVVIVRENSVDNFFSFTCGVKLFFSRASVATSGSP
jgi:hypothetical protein